MCKISNERFKYLVDEANRLLDDIEGWLDDVARKIKRTRSRYIKRKKEPRLLLLSFVHYNVR